MGWRILAVVFLCLLTGTVFGACVGGGEDPLYCETWNPTVDGASGCRIEFTGCTDGKVYEVECAVVGTQAACGCKESSVSVGNFTSDGFCTFSGTAQKDAANVGCGWDIEG